MFLLEGVKPTENTESKIAADGGALLWLYNSKIFGLYIDKCRKFNINIVLFNGYNKLTKDAAHKERSNKMSQVVEISDGNACPSDRAEFLTNYTNKQKFVNSLARKLELHGFKAVLCPSDADTTIVKTCLQFQDKPVTVLADDTDILCLLLHHMYHSNNKNEIYLKNMTIYSFFMHLQVAARPHKYTILVKSQFLASLKCRRTYNIFQNSFTKPVLQSMKLEMQVFEFLNYFIQQCSTYN